MQKQYIIPFVDADGKQISMEIQQKNIQINQRKVKTWTSEEDNQLIELYETHPKKWSEIAMLMTDRNENQCLHRYRRLSQQGKKHKIWSSEEDETIKKLIKKYGKNWKLLSEMLGSKNGKQIRERFINKLDPKIKIEEWSSEEDRKIIELFSKIGSKWSEISKQLPGRPENKIKNRFYSFIQKNYDIKYKEIENTKLISTEETKSETNNKQSPQIFSSKCEDVVLKSHNGIEHCYKDFKMQDERVMSRFAIPSINEIEFELRNDNLISNNLLDSVMRVEDEWRSNIINYQSIAELNSTDLFLRLQN